MSRHASDTIIALASGAGRAGVAVIRISGSSALRLLSDLTGRPVPEPHRAALRTLRSSNGETLDEALVLAMLGPKSFTGEDVAELHVHGGPAIISAVLAEAISTGLCRLAEPGEFTRRAFENQRLDLTQAEAVADLIDAETEGQRRQAARLYSGEATRIFDGWRDQLIAAMASLEAAIDFPDEADVPEEIALRALEPIETLATSLEAALRDADRLEAVREGFRIAILGPPNAGKSSLINHLAKRDAAIVSPIPGTTRDVVEVRLVLAGFPVWVADTAGLRETADEIEAEGVRRALARAEAADLRIWMTDLSAAPDVSRETPSGSRRAGDLSVFNKADVAAEQVKPGPDTLVVSLVTGQGLDALDQRLTRIVRERLEADEAPLVTRARHRELVQDAVGYIRRALGSARTGVGAELVSEDLRLAARALGRVTGTVDVEDLLDRIFADFCIGK